MGVTLRSRLIAAVLSSFICSTAALAQGSPPANTKATDIPVNDFVRPAIFSEVQISPNGKYISALMPNPDNPHENFLAILDGKTAKVLNVIHSGSSALDAYSALVASYFWVSDDRLVATLAFKHSFLDTPLLRGRLFAINADGSHQRDLWVGGYNIRPISTQPVDQDHILIAANDNRSGPDGSYTQIKRLDIQYGGAGSKRLEIQQGGAGFVGIGTSPVINASLIADHAGQVRVAFAATDMVHVSMWLRPNNDAPWALANDPPKSHVGIMPIGFNRDNSKLYVKVTQGNRPDAIELMDMGSQQLTMIFQGQFADPGELLPTADHLDYYAVISRDGIPALHYIDENSLEAQLSKALAVNFPGQLAYFSSFTSDSKHAIVRVTSDRNPGVFLLFDMDSRHAKYLFSAAPWIDSEKMRPMQPIELKARDGLVLRGFLTMPSGNKPRSLIVLPHGGPHGIADQWGFDPEVQLFASQGYAVLQVNYRGSGGYGSTFQAIGYRQWGLRMQDDLTDATQWAIEQGYADPKRICIYGASYGGYAALEGVVREPNLYKCAIGYAGVYDLRVQMDLSDTDRTSMGDAYLHLTLGDDRADLLQRSPLSGVDQIKADILLLHGEEDPRVPFKNFREFTKALDENGKHYDSLVEPHEGHGFFLPEHRQEAYQKMLDFLDRNIGAGSSTAD